MTETEQLLEVLIRWANFFSRSCRETPGVKLEAEFLAPDIDILTQALLDLRLNLKKAKAQSKGVQA